jgi:hypothetical protein
MYQFRKQSVEGLHEWHSPILSRMLRLKAKKLERNLLTAKSTLNRDLQLS